MPTKQFHINWVTTPNLITASFNVGSHTYSVTFSKSPDNFNSNIKRLFEHQAQIIVPDDAWKITIEMEDEATHIADWLVTTENGVLEFAKIVEATQHFQSLANPTTMILVCQKDMFHRISVLLAHTVRTTWNVTPINGQDDSYFYFSKKITTSV